MEFDLLEVLGECDHTGMFSSNYWDWEERVANVILKSKGYRVIRWWSPDKDSFGPLVRGVDVITPNGEKRTLTYG